MKFEQTCSSTTHLGVWNYPKPFLPRNITNRTPTKPQKRLFQQITLIPPQPLKVKKEGHRPPKLSNPVTPRNPKSRAGKTSLESVSSDQKPNPEEKWNPMKSEKKV